MSEQTIRVLLLDDEESLREPLTNYLHDTHGFVVDPAKTSSVALQLLEAAQGRYDVALLDTVLDEDLNGLDVLQRIKAKYPEIEVILFTTWEMQVGIEALRAGAYRYFAKPFDKDELAMTIRFAAEYGQARRERKILEAFRKVSTAISSTLNPDEILRHTCQAAVELFGIDHSGLVEFAADYASGKVVAEFPDKGALGTVLQVRGVPLEEHLVYQKEVLNISDVAAEQALGSVRDVLVNLGIQSILVVPVVLQDRVVASFSLDALQKRRTFYPNEIELCKSLADQVAVAIQNARLYDETRQGRDYLQSLYEATTEITLSREPSKVLEDIVATACRATGAWRAVILVIEPDGRPRSIAPFRFDHHLDLAESIRPNGISIQVIQSGQAQFIPDAEAEVDRVNPAMLAQGAKAAACLPLSLLGNKVGVLWIHFREKHTFSETEKQALQLYANQSAIAYDNSRRMRELEQLKNAAEAMAGKAEWQAVLKEIAKSAKQVLDANYTLIWPYDAAREIFFPEDLVAENVPNDLLKKFKEEEPSSGSTTERVLQQGYIAIEKLDSPQAEFVGRTTRGFLEQLEVKSFQGIRLDVAGEPLGVLFADYKHSRGFGEEDRRILEHFANHAALTLKKARLFEQVRRSHDAAKAVAQVSTLGDLDKTLNETVKGAQAVLRCDIATLYAFDTEKQQFVRSAGVGCRDEKNMRPPTEIGADSVLWKIIDLHDKKYHLAEDVGNDLLLKGRFVQVEGVQSVLAIRLRFGENRVGVMFVNYRTPHRFTDDEIQDALQFANQAAVAIRNARRFGETESILAARTALAWTGMLGSTWRHAIEKHALTIREQIQLLRADLVDRSKADAIDKRLGMIERLANQILERPLTPPLSAEEGVVSLPINDFLRERTKQLWAHEPYRLVTAKLDLHLDDSATVRASPEWLRRAFDILIDNAVEATVGVAGRKIVIGSQRRDNYAEISITDNGRGIPTEVLERLFREPIKKPQGAKGQGIGLLMAQTIVHTYGGSISCRETGSTGTTVIVSLPLES